MKVRWNDEFITDFVSSVTWSGSASQASRTLSFTVANSPYDVSFQKLNIALGDLIYFYDEGKCLFVGVITDMTRTGQIGSLTYTAKDFMHYLLRSTGAYVFKHSKPEAITEKVCRDIQIKTGTLAKTGKNIKSLIIENDSYYNIILKAYAKAAQKHGEAYMPVMDGIRLSVILKGEFSGITLDSVSDLTSSSYSQTTSDMVNRVWIVNNKNKMTGHVKDTDSINRYGIYQSIYKKEKGVNAKKAAKKLLTGITSSASVEAIGNVACVSGYAINIRDNASGLIGRFYIDSDSHKYENGTHTMSLQLAFENKMEEV